MIEIVYVPGLDINGQVEMNGLLLSHQGGCLAVRPRDSEDNQTFYSQVQYLLAGTALEAYCSGDQKLLKACKNTVIGTQPDWSEYPAPILIEKDQLKMACGDKRVSVFWFTSALLKTDNHTRYLALYYALATLLNWKENRDWRDKLTTVMPAQSAWDLLAIGESLQCDREILEEKGKPQAFIGYEESAFEEGIKAWCNMYGLY